MDCPDADTLNAMASGSLSAAVRAEIANHAAVCVTCHEVITGMAIEPADAAAATAGDADPGELLDVRRGTRIGRYVVESRLGAGGMGVVYAAMDSELHRRVAVKLLRPDHQGDLGTRGRERLMREARTLARLSHPNVVTVFDVGQHGGDLFLAMELVDGGSLKTWLARAPRTPEIIDRLIEAGRGLAAAHAAGVVHRDVKPDNILVGADGRARVTDFGLAHLGDAAATPDASGADVVATTVASITRTGAVMGTPAYMAPEQLARGETTASTDQWSYCATLYEALVGSRPGAAPAEMRRIPPWLRPVVQRGLQVDPARRWPSMDAVVREIVRRRHRRRNLALALAAVAVVGAIVAAVATVQRRRAGPQLPRTPDLATVSPRWSDNRVGCDCPYSACRDGCVSVCRARGFTLGAAVPGISLAGRQEALAGASGDGDAILFLAGDRCNIDRLMLARRHGATYESIDLTDQLDRSRVAIFEGCCTLAADGKTMIVATADHASFVRFELRRDTAVALGGAEFARLMPPDVTGRALRFPVVTADGLTLYYRFDDLNEAGDAGPLDGNYEASRTRLDAPFDQPHKLKGRARQYEYVTGVSADNLSLFMAADFETHVLVRATTAEPFGAPGTNTSPQLLYGWRAVPLADCNQILTTSTPGGCDGEDIVVLDARDR